MADITNILGGPWSPPADRILDPPEVQLRTAMLNAGLVPPDQIIFDGQLRRFRSGTRGEPGKGDKPGWYVAYADNVPAGRFGCWRAGIEVAWRADIGRELTTIEEMAHARRMQEAQALRRKEQERKADTASEVITQIWAKAQIADPAHQYLARKGVGVHGTRVTGDGRLVVPMYDDQHQLCSLQYIDSEGTKRYHAGAPTGGAHYLIGAVEHEVCIVEGFATGATVHEVTGLPVAIAFSASNLPKIAEILRKRHGNHCRIIVMADHDDHGVGQRYADQAAQQSGATVILPPIVGMDANDYHQSGHDLAALLRPKPSTWLVPVSDFTSKTAPIRWLIKRWIQAESLIMIHGPSGGGKTFVMLDMLCHIAAGLPTWMGHKVTPGPVVYLAGEGHHGLKGRIKAWMQEHDRLHGMDMWISGSGCDLNTPEGYQKVVDSIRSMNIQPSVISVDTLHRFLFGDENSAQDAKTMIDACARLMREFRCTVILVHHTGVSEDAQHRARGSSAWKGALEIEISVQPRKDNQITLIQRKAKDAEIAEPIHIELQSIAIDGWTDDDGEQVCSAVIIQGDAPAERKAESKLDAFKKIFAECWLASGTEIKEENPYVSRSAMKHYLTETMDLTPSTADTYIKPGKTDLLIGALVLGGVIQGHADGWIVMDQVLLSAMLPQRGKGKIGEN
jgi:putative DNA primase/helicase